MRICFAIGTLSYSGAEKIMYHLLKEFKKRGYDVSVMLLSCDKPYDNLDGIKQFPIDDINEEMIQNKFIRVLLRERRIRKVITSNDFDVLVSFGVKFNLDIAEACFLKKISLVLCERNDPVFDPASKFLRIRRNISYHRGNGFVFQTSRIRDYFSARIKNKSTVIPNFIDERIDERNLNVEKRQSFATCARLDDNQKNQSGLIKAFKKFHESHLEYKLEFYGDGPDREKYELLIKKLGIESSVIFHGRVSNPMEEIKRCSFFVFTSKYEGMPNALIEAMSYGMPCIATDCGGGGAGELIVNKQNGLLIPYDDEAALITAMEWVHDNRNLARKMGYEAYAINNKLDKNKIVDLWENYLLQISGEIR